MSRGLIQSATDQVDFKSPHFVIKIYAATDINRWMAEGKLKARIDRILPLSEAVTAHRLQEESTIHKTGALAGKIVLKR